MDIRDTPYGDITWVLCVPDPVNPNRIVPFLHRHQGTVWFSEPQYIDRFLRENATLPPGARSRAVLGKKALHKLATDLLKAGVQRVYVDLEYGKDPAGESLAACAQRLDDALKEDARRAETSSRNRRFQARGLRRPG